MLRQIARLFARYSYRHGEISLPALRMHGSDGRILGVLERISLSEGHVVVEGWALAEEVGLTGPDHTTRIAPHKPRSDVLSKLAYASGTPGFALELPMPDGAITFWAQQNGKSHSYPLPILDRKRALRMRVRLAARFGRSAITALPAATRWFLHRDPRAIAQIKTIFGLNAVMRARRLDASLFAEGGHAAPPMHGGVSIVMPVYNAFDLLPEVLDRVRTHTDLPWRLTVIEDCSTDPLVRPWLRHWVALLGAERDRVTLIENDSNLGFIGSVNRGLASVIPQGDPVILLNSDALVPPGWASRLLEPMQTDPSVASVTPMSNDAEIFTAPVICQPMPLQPGEAEAIDQVAQQFAQGPAQAEAPTGVGFCMAMNIAYLRRLPELDPAFGQGYGEEVDWCRRARALGGRHLGTARLFVEHRGGSSFGSAEKLKLVQANNAIVTRRYPTYDQEVQDFLRKDPLATPRLALALAWAARRQRGAVPVYLAHDMGGGAEMYLHRRIKADLQQDAAAVVLRVGGQLRWQLELHTAKGVLRGATGDLDIVRRLLGLLSRRHLVYSCAVGDRDPITLPEVMLSLVTADHDTVEVLIHDFLPLSPAYTLLGQDGAFHGVPDAGTNADPAHVARRPDGTRVTLAEWRAAWGRLVTRANQVTVFSANSRGLVAQAYPDAAGRIVVAPHALLEPVSRVAPGVPRDGKVVIGVLGNIGYPKGAAILRDMSRELARTKAARIVLIGNLDPSYALAAPSEVHGSYRIADIPALVQKYGISRWFIPSIWPETFSFAMHEALATGLPVFAFDLGAQGHAAAEADPTRVLALPSGPAALHDAIARITGPTETTGS